MHRLLLLTMLAAPPLLAGSPVEIVAHRGASFDAPENTRTSLKLAWQQGADAAEFDVWLTKDGRIVALHDDTLQRTGGIERKIGDVTEAEARAIDVGRWMDERFAGELLPTLGELLELVPPSRRVFIEVKCGSEIVPELDRVLRQAALKPEQTAVIAFDADVIAELKKLRPDLQAYWLASLEAKKDQPSPTAAELIATARKIQADGLNLSATTSVLTEGFAAALREAKMPYYVWTVNDADVARRMIQLGARAITTDRPEWLRQRLAEDPAVLRVMTYNIRYANPGDGPNRWENRKEQLCRTIERFDPDLLGTQEVLASQRDDLKKRLKRHHVFAAGRDDGKDRGETAAIFYRKQRFEKLDGGHFWLSETPDRAGSRGWDAALPRIATWLKLKDRNQPNAPPLFVLNTHFDHRGATARLESARLIMKKLDGLAAGCRIVLLGDFNAGESSEAYSAVFAREDGRRTLVDVYRAANPTRQKHESTFSRFLTQPSTGDRIDWIGCSPDWAICSADIDRNGTKGRAPSDHFAVTALLAPIGENRPQLRVLTYNIRHGRGMDQRIDLVRIADVIRAAKPDLVALQEVDKLTKRSGGVDQTLELAQRTGLNGRFAKAIDYDGGEYGQAVLSRFPIDSAATHQLPGTPDREQRIGFEIGCIADGRPLRFATTHLHHNNRDFREQQAAALDDIFTGSRVPVILAGDFNAEPASTVMLRLGERWRLLPKADDAFTFPADKPVKQIDFVLLRPAEHFRVVEERVIEADMASDHRPVLIVLEWLTPPPQP